MSCILIVRVEQVVFSKAKAMDGSFDEMKRITRLPRRTFR
jgi:hypothetical protein